MDEPDKIKGKELEKVIEKKVEKEVKRRLHLKMIDVAKSSTKEFRDEFRKQTLIAITGAFAFLIALTWRTPIQNSIDKLIVSLGLSGQTVYYEYLAAVLITLIGVIVLIIISKWAVKNN